MKVQSNRLASGHPHRSLFTSLVVIAALAAITAGGVEAQTFNSGSDGSDGALVVSGPAGTVVIFDPTQFHGSQVAANIFNFTTVTIAPGVTLRLGGDRVSGPVIWLAQGDVDIQGSVDLSGGSGHVGTSNPFARVASIPGAGGFSGGVGGNNVQAPTAGNGPHGAAIVPGTGNRFGAGGTFGGNQFLVPLVGGSGGSGSRNSNNGSYFAPGGGAGGGAIMIVSSTQILIRNGGGIHVNGGDASSDGVSIGGAGSGGSIRLVATTISTNSNLTASGGSTNSGTTNGGGGVIRLETYNLSGPPGGATVSSPFPLLLPTSGPATAKVISIGGTTFTPNPNTFPDVTINTTAPVDVIIQTHNVPTSATVNLTILDQNGVGNVVIQAPPLGNCDQNNFCTTTVPVTFPFGASRGLTRVTWVQ